jgi:leucyl-tRNA synthetase
MNFNTAIAAMMEFSHELLAVDPIPKDVWKQFVLLLSPFAPHMCEELRLSWAEKGSVVQEKWPEYNARLVQDATFALVVQVNGRVRDQITVNVNISERHAKDVALQSIKVQKWLANKEPKRFIYVKNKLINIVF